ncbi:hypothetical protein MAPG_01971 [Magnaporthiopsis poae ATCC 64411]|uniref:Uncharacterized protein n=1 Tax=Magnaporthiopsis poae (strain ATCC 64411 / 73-15) TaxID=644358 RepID=A0A0C4DQ34_MAGP6|nr:hypothetical protein MAPG_01971 [Magnaporthiopsis poae ATCC 64411]
MDAPLLIWTGREVGVDASRAYTVTKKNIVLSTPVGPGAKLIPITNLSSRLNHQCTTSQAHGCLVYFAFIYMHLVGDAFTQQRIEPYQLRTAGLILGPRKAFQGSN